MFSGRVSRGYTSASRQPNSLANSSIGPLPPLRLSWHREHRTEGRWRSKRTTPGLCRDRSAQQVLSPAVRRARGNFKYFWVDFRPNMVAFRLFSAEASGTLYHRWINLLQGAFDIGRDAVGGRCVLLVDDLYCSGAIATVFAQ